MSGQYIKIHYKKFTSVCIEKENQISLKQKQTKVNAPKYWARRHDLSSYSNL